MPFARTEVTFYHSEKDVRGYVREAELLEEFTFEGEGTLGRLAYASAASELLGLLLPEEEPQRQLYTYYVNYLKHVEKIPKSSLPAVFIAFFLRLLSHLGYHPSLAFCVGCGKDVKSLRKTARMSVSIDRGGMVCETCQKPGDYYIGFSTDEYDRLLTLQTASLDEASSVTLKFAQATRIMEMLTRFLAGQTGMKSDLKSLEFIEKLKNSQLIG